MTFLQILAENQLLFAWMVGIVGPGNITHNIKYISLGSVGWQSYIELTQ